MHNKIETELETNIRYIESRFEGCADAVMRRILVGDEKLGMYVVYMDSMYDRDFIDGVVLKSLLFDRIQLPDQNAGQVIFNKYLATADVKETNRMEMLIDEVLKGNTAIFIDGMAKAMIVSSKNLPGRGVSEAETEVSVRGSKESFTESFRVNTVLIRRRIRDTRLKSRQMTIGVRSKTDVALMYMEDLVHEELLEEIKNRLEEYKIDGILDSGMLEQLTEKPWYSPFPQYQVTERPDRTALELLNGKIALLCDNSPSALILPGAFSSFMESSEDWYHHFEMATFLRILRYLALLTATLLPGLYLAVIRFHTQILPTNLLLSFADAREGVPFSSVTELILLELAFELIREAGVRVPGALGNAIGIVGGLIIGDAAVSANLVSPIVVMIVALTALGSMVIPDEEFAAAFRLLKYGFLILGGYLGIYGVVLGIYLTVSHLSGLLSFGIPYLVPFVEEQSVRQTGNGIFRIPFKARKYRPVYARKEQSIRLRKITDRKERES